MTFTKCVCVVLAVLLVMFVQPARAEAMEMIFISLIISGAIVVVVLIAILIIANVEGDSPRRRSSQVEPPTHPLVVFEIPAPATQSP